MASRLNNIDPLGDDVQLDEGIMEALPSECRVLSTSRGGKSFWVETLRIDVKLLNGTVQSFFKKGAAGDLGLAMMRGAYESEKALYNYVPEFVPRPVAYGSYKSRKDTHFYLAEFVEMDDTHPPTPQGWAIAVATLHKRSAGKSPGGRFGFHLNTHLANVPVDNTWNISWEALFTQQLRSMCDIEEAKRPHDVDYTKLKERFFTTVIPRYIRPLEMDGRTVQPVLLHNDLWPGNVRQRTNDPETVCLFDSACFWGHNEVDNRVTRPNLYGLEEAGEAYRAIMGISEPKNEYFIRLDVYSVFGLVLRSSMYDKQPERRIMIVDMMKGLVEKVALEKVALAPTLRTLGNKNCLYDAEDDGKKCRDLVGFSKRTVKLA